MSESEFKQVVKGFIETEIQWCEDNASCVTPDYSEGFIAGLKHAMTLIEAAEKATEKELRDHHAQP